MLFSADISVTKVNYLDLEVFIENGRMCTKLFRKPTAGNSILHSTSSHPSNLISSIPYGELLRIKRNGTNENDFLISAEVSIARFKKRGYSTKLLETTLHKVQQFERKVLFEEHGKSKDEKKCRMVTTFSKGADQLRNILRKNWNLLKMDPVIGSDVPARPMITFRKARALRDMVTSSHFIQKKERIHLG